MPHLDIPPSVSSRSAGQGQQGQGLGGRSYGAAGVGAGREGEKEAADRERQRLQDIDSAKSMCEFRSAKDAPCSGSWRHDSADGFVPTPIFDGHLSRPQPELDPTRSPHPKIPSLPCSNAPSIHTATTTVTDTDTPTTTVDIPKPHRWMRFRPPLSLV